MALTVGTDSYVTLAEADAYFLTRPHSSNWSDSVSDADKENALRMAAFHIDLRYEWLGSIAVAGQAMEWPRSGLYYHGAEVASTAYPEPLKKAQFEMGYQWLGGDQLTPPPTFLTSADQASLRMLKREKLGTLEREYFENKAFLWEVADGSFRKKLYPYVDMLLQPFYYGKSGSMFVDILR